jgi:hypothetical protein
MRKPIYEILAQVNIVPIGFRITLPSTQVIECMIPNPVTALSDPTHNIGMLAYIIANTEKCSLNAVPTQDVQNPFSDAGYGSIVKSEEQTLVRTFPNQAGETSSQPTGRAIRDYSWHVCDSGFADVAGKKGNIITVVVASLEHLQIIDNF